MHERSIYLHHACFVFWIFNMSARFAKLRSGTKILQVWGRFPFDQKHQKIRVAEQMKKTLSGISILNFGCNSRGWPKIPENRNNQKNSFHSTIPARAQVSPSLEIELNMADSRAFPYNISARHVYYLTNDLNLLLRHYCSGVADIRKWLLNSSGN